MKFSPGQTFGGHWMILEKGFLGKGGFGTVFKVKSEKYDKMYAAKVQEKSKSDLSFEKEVYSAVNPCNNRVGFPHVHACYDENNCVILVMEQLGSSLRHLCKERNGLSNHSILMIGIQAVRALRCVHDAGYVHRDIKARNFLIGHGKDEKYIFMVDMGLAKRFLDEEGKHIPLIKGRGHVGTRDYESPNSHKGYTLSRRDDLWSLAYMLVELRTVSLPWSGGSEAVVAAQKEGTSIKDLCKGLPSAINKLLEYTASLNFEDRPEYTKIITAFECSLKSRSLKNDLKFDWMK